MTSLMPTTQQPQQPPQITHSPHMVQLGQLAASMQEQIREYDEQRQRLAAQPAALEQTHGELAGTILPMLIDLAKHVGFLATLSQHTRHLVEETDRAVSGNAEILNEQIDRIDAIEDAIEGDSPQLTKEQHEVFERVIFGAEALLELIREGAPDMPAATKEKLDLLAADIVTAKAMLEEIAVVEEQDDDEDDAEGEEREAADEDDAEDA